MTTNTTTTDRPKSSDLQASWEVRDANRARFSGSKHVDECFLCGRGLTESAVANGWYIHLHAATGDLLPEGWDPEDDGEDWNASQGCFPVGSECAKRIARPYKFRMGQA